MGLYVDQEYAINNDKLRVGNEVGIARMARRNGDTWAMSPETAEKLEWALIAASREFGPASTCPVIGRARAGASPMTGRLGTDQAKGNRP